MRTGYGQLEQAKGSLFLQGGGSRSGLDRHGNLSASDTVWRRLTNTTGPEMKAAEKASRFQRIASPYSNSPDITIQKPAGVGNINFGTNVTSGSVYNLLMQDVRRRALDKYSE